MSGHKRRSEKKLWCVTALESEFFLAWEGRREFLIHYPRKIKKYSAAPEKKQAGESAGL